jgi:AMMECR1 domain-containing protein
LTINLSESDNEQLTLLVWQVLQSSLTQGEFTLQTPAASKALQQNAATFVTLYTYK